MHKRGVISKKTNGKKLRCCKDEKQEGTTTKKQLYALTNYNVINS